MHVECPSYHIILELTAMMLFLQFCKYKKYPKVPVCVIISAFGHVFLLRSIFSSLRSIIKHLKSTESEFRAEREYQAKLCLVFFCSWIADIRRVSLQQAAVQHSAIQTRFLIPQSRCLQL